jgi:hypothetical protein
MIQRASSPIARRISLMHCPTEALGSAGLDDQRASIRFFYRDNFPCVLSKVAQNLEGLSPQRNLESTPKQRAADSIEREFVKPQSAGRRSKHLMPLD